MGKTKRSLLKEAWEEQEAALTPLAFVKADAWARSMPGTEYGVTEPVLEVLSLDRVPAPVDERVMARLKART